MKYFYDTEFLEDGRTIDLISIGIVAEDGREYYAVNADADWGRIARHPWLVENVVSKLGVKRSERKSHDRIRDEVARFLDPFQPYTNPALRGHRNVGAPELWAWYGAYDHICLAQLFGRMIDLPPWIPMWTNDLRQEQHRLGDPKLPAQPAGLHNALDDARHLRVQYDALLGAAK
ncbi:3'-5' exoribonuclease domain-containing protein [Rhodococcus sp. YH1]|uniref:3'-5' exoribonuclease domain-containing protein n=1 Tax=Rhodococcus sp. YH1 TaxID=89066 RepID=UPI0013875132|nr:3'-5' exoribonuclease.1 [Rhodococcus sp. YH1]